MALAMNPQPRRPIRSVPFFLISGLCLLIQTPASAQGLIWSLPEDGTEIRYEGTYKQVEFRPNSAEGDLTIEWIRHVILKSVGSEMAEYQGEQVPCRWLELKVVTGRASESGVLPGPGGDRIYKVLVPEPAIQGQLVDSENIPVSFIPIVRGFRKSGDQQAQPEPIESEVLQIYPGLSLLRHYRTFVREPNESEDIVVSGESFLAEKYKGTEVLESPISRSTQEAEIWRSNDIPFGVARWTVKVLRETKTNIDPRSEFERFAEITVTMQAQEIGRSARSELAVP